MTEVLRLEDSLKGPYRPTAGSRLLGRTPLVNGGRWLKRKVLRSPKAMRVILRSPARPRHLRLRPVWREFSAPHPFSAT